jgi:Spy/CpxP family protein refolding chaperone
MKLIQGSFTKRALMVGLLAGSGLLAASAFAMPAGGFEGKSGCETRHGHETHAKWSEHRAERLSALKEKLKLQPGQEAAWNAFVSTSKTGKRPMGDDRQTKREEFAKLNTPQRLDKMLAMSDVHHANMVERTQTIKTFYAQLTPEQQSVFDAETMQHRHQGNHNHHNHRQQS